MKLSCQFQYHGTKTNEISGGNKHYKIQKHLQQKSLNDSKNTNPSEVQVLIFCQQPGLRPSTLSESVPSNNNPLHT